MHYHFIGIGGIGMSALARVLLGQKVKVTGSDVATSSVIEELIREGAEVSIGHNSQHIHKEATVVYNSMINKENPEFDAALKLQCPMMHRSDLLGAIGKKYKTLAVTGTHGKTSTSSLLAVVLKQAGMNPAYALGGLLLSDGLNGGSGQGEYFVVEADESDASFLKYPVFGGIVTNIDRDHLDFYGSEEALKAAFSKFMKGIDSKEHLFWCKDDAILRAVAEEGISYGFKSHAELMGSRLRQEGWKMLFDVHFKGRDYLDVELQLLGEHQALNALAVFGLALTLGISEETIRLAFKSFSGIARRCEKICDQHDILILDDYAHHPTEIKATLKGIRKACGDRRLVAVFQPHRFSRTMLCLDQFKDAFDYADELIVTDIYGAFETPVPGITEKSVLYEVQSYSTIPCSYVPKEQIREVLIEKMRPHDVVVTLNAGDLNKISHDVGRYFQKHAPKKLCVGVLCGGKSSEHEVSLRSAKYIQSALAEDSYEVQPFCISKEGDMGDLAALAQCDVVIPVLHGPFGEDGMMQGFLDILDKAYVGCDHRSSAICMDKALTKRLLMTHGMKTASFVDFSFSAWEHERTSLLHHIMKTLEFPVFVKPVHLGSSVGIKKVVLQEELGAAIDTAFTCDTHVLVEEMMVGREVEFAVLGNHDLFIPNPGEILTHGRVYDYEAKYSDDGMKAQVPADLSMNLIEKGKKMAAKAYKACGCTGLARVDFFLDQTGEYWLNEINPFPGFTSISVYPQAMEAAGLSGRELLDKLIILGLARKRLLDRHMRVE